MQLDKQPNMVYLAEFWGLAQMEQQQKTRPYDTT